MDTTVAKAYNNYNSVIKYLYDTYYANFQNHSNVTSSFWKTIGSHKAEYVNDKLCLEGSGFGAIIHKTALNSARHSYRIHLCRTLLDKYKCPPSLRDKGAEVASKTERLFGFDCVKQVIALQTILSSLTNTKDIDVSSFPNAGIKTVCVIGDGYGYLTSLLKTFAPELKVVCVNLGKTLLFDSSYVKMVLPDQPVALLAGEETKKELFDQYSLLFLEAERYELLQDLPIDLFINIASMQEMDKKVIRNYFKYMRNSSSENKYFYCCNRIEKNLPDGAVIRFSKYPWQAEDLIMLDELCPWFQKYPSMIPPFWQPFDGQIKHRLVKFA